MSQAQNQYETTQNNTNLTAGGAGDAPLEKDYGNGYHLHDDMDSETALKKIQTSGSLSISPELFEKIYLSPQNRVAGDLRKTFANPTPLALIGFLISLTPLSCDLMGWRGAGGNGAASTGAYLSFGGVLMLLGTVGEFILGNTFPMVVFGTYGVFWILFAYTLIPFFNTHAAYATEEDPTGLRTPGFNASFGFIMLWMAFASFIYTVCAIRTNAVLFTILLFLIPAFGCLAGAYWQNAQGNFEFGTTLTVAAGATSFVSDILGWYLFAAILLASLDFPFTLPVGDLSTLVKGASQKEKEKKAKEQYSA